MKKGKDGFYCRYIKRVLDIVCSVLALAVLGIPLMVVAVLVRVKLGKPVLFKQKRIGKNNKEFYLLKFRTMREDRDANGVYLPDEERLIPFGKSLRGTSIDELPSLINILKGEMSVIGPRPLPVRYLPRYSEEQLRRHEVKPGLSSPSTVKGRNIQSWEDQFAGDVEYVDSVTFATDVKSIFDTVKVVFTREGSTSGDGGSRTEFIGLADVNDLQDRDGNYVKLREKTQ